MTPGYASVAGGAHVGRPDQSRVLGEYAAAHRAWGRSPAGAAALPLDAPAIADYAAGVHETTAALGLDRYAVYGFHTGALIGLELARQQPRRVAAAVLDGLPVFDDREREAHLAGLPTFPPRWDGGHLTALWSRFRDQYVFWPWYRREPAARSTAPSPTRAPCTPE